MSTDRTKFYLDVLSGHEVEIHCSSFVRRNHSNQKSNVLLDLVKLVRTQSYDKVRLSSVIKHNRTHSSPKTFSNQAQSQSNFDKVRWLKL